MGSCPVACCTKLPAAVASQRIYIPPPVPPPPPPPYMPYFQPQQQPWPTTCPGICRTKCVSSCPIHCCSSTVLDNLRRLANARSHHDNVAKSLTPVNPDARLHHQGDKKESSSALQPPPLSLAPLISTPSISSSCPTICSTHCTPACTPECCVARAKTLSSPHLEKRDLGRQREFLHRRKPGKRIATNKH